MGNNQLIMDNFSSAKVSSSICCVLVSEQDIPIFFLLSPRRWREGIGDSASQGMGKAVIPEKNKNLKKKKRGKIVPLIQVLLSRELENKIMHFPSLEKSKGGLEKGWNNLG